MALLTPGSTQGFKVCFEPGIGFLLDILADHAVDLKKRHPEINKWLLVDHGSPRKEVAAVRDRIAADFADYWHETHPDDLDQRG